MNETAQSIQHLDPDTLNAFIDGELSQQEQQGTKQHLAGCHACTLRVLSATQLKAATAKSGHRFAPPPEALARLTSKLQLHGTHTQQLPQKKTSARIFSLRPVAWAALAAAILLTVSLLSWRQLHQTDSLAAELLDQHLAALSSGATPQVISTDRHTVKPWFQGRLPFSFNIPDATALPADTTLQGADLTYLDGQPAALLLFTIHKHEVSVFVTRRSTSPTLTTLPNTREGFTLHTATTSNLRLTAVSDVNPAELDLLLGTMVHAQN